MNETEWLKIVSGNIKYYRKRSDWSQEKLAEKINVSVNFLSAIESCRKWPSPTTLLKMAEVFQVEAYELLKSGSPAVNAGQQLIGKYTEDVHSAVDRICGKYLVRVKRKK
jgi:transcriptional regulator with XRE-family HTH domain